MGVVGDAHASASLPNFIKYTFSDISPQGPYGGFKQSGFGRTGGLEGLYEFLQVKNIRIGMG